MFGPLLSAAKDDDAAQVDAILASGAAHAKVTNQIGQSALHVASIWGSTAAAAVLIGAKADVNMSNQFGVTPLHYAAQNSRYEVAKLLIEHGASMTARAQNGLKPHEIAKEDEMRVLCGAPALKLHGAVRNADAREIERLIAEGGDLSEADHEGNTALHLALASDAPPELVSQMVDALLLGGGGGGAASSATLSHALCTYSRSGVLPLHVAASNGTAAHVRALLAAGAPPSAKTQLVGHMFNGEWVRRGADGAVDALGADDRTALHLAVEREEERAGDDSDEEDEDSGGGGGEGGGDEAPYEAVMALLEAKADPNARDKDGRTPLHAAIGGGLLELTRRLLSAHADPTLGCKTFGSESNCLHQAVLTGSLPIVELLLAAGGASGVPPARSPLDMDATGRDGWTPLCLAARAGHVGVVKALLHAGADKTRAMPNGKTAAEVATINKRAAVLALLE